MTAGGSNGSNETAASAAAARGKRQALHSPLFSSSSLSPPSPSPTEPSPEGLFLVGSKLNGSAHGFGNGAGGREDDGGGGNGGGGGGLSSLLIVPPRGTTGDVGGHVGGGGGGSTTAGWAGSSGRRGWSGGGRQGTLGEKVVARALECLEGLCGSEECERFMTPLAREVGFACSKKAPWYICTTAGQP